MVNQDHLIDTVTTKIKEDNTLANNQAILEILLELYSLKKDYPTAFHILVKLKSKKTFEFIKKIQLDFDL